MFTYVLFLVEVRCFVCRIFYKQNLQFATIQFFSLLPRYWIAISAFIQNRVLLLLWYSNGLSTIVLSLDGLPVL